MYGTSTICLICNNNLFSKGWYDYEPDQANDGYISIDILMSEKLFYHCIREYQFKIFVLKVPRIITHYISYV